MGTTPRQDIGENWKPVLTGLFAALWLLDSAATVAFVAEYGSAMEANPFMRALIDEAGIAAFAITKAAVLALWLSVHLRAHVWIHCALVAVMVPVVIAACQVAWSLA